MAAAADKNNKGFDRASHCVVLLQPAFESSFKYFRIKIAPVSTLKIRDR